MGRQDILMDAKYGEVETTDQLAGKTIYDFYMLEDTEGPDGDNCCYGEMVVPAGFRRSYREEKGIHIDIPYRAIYKKLVVRLRQETGSGNVEYLMNESNYLMNTAYRKGDIKLVNLVSWYASPFLRSLVFLMKKRIEK